MVGKEKIFAPDLASWLIESRRDAGEKMTEKNLRCRIILHLWISPTPALGALCRTIHLLRHYTQKIP
jgi:hypothetical protein